MAEENKQDASDGSELRRENLNKTKSFINVPEKNNADFSNLQDLKYVDDKEAVVENTAKLKEINELKAGSNEVSVGEQKSSDANTNATEIGEQKKEDKYFNPFKDGKTGTLGRDEENKAGDQHGFESPDVSGKNGDIIDFMFNEWLMKGVNKVLTKSIDAIQWTAYGVGYVAIEGTKSGANKISDKNSAKKERRLRDFGKFGDIAKVFDDNADDRSGKLDYVNKELQKKVIRNIIEGELEGDFPSKQDMLLYSSVAAANTINGQTLARTMAKQQMLAEAIKNPSAVKDEKALAKDFQARVDANEAKVFLLSSNMSPVEASKFLGEAQKSLDDAERKFISKDGKKDFNLKPLNELNKHIEDKYQSSLNAYEKVKKENPEVASKGEKLKTTEVNKSFKSDKGNFFKDEAALRREIHKETFAKTKESQIDKIMTKDGCSREIATAKVQMRHNVQSVAKNMAYAEVMSDKKVDKMTEAEKMKHLDKVTRTCENKVFKSLNQVVDGYKEGALSSDQKVAIRTRTLNEISAVSSNAAMRASQPENDGSIIENNKYLSTANAYMKEISKDAEDRRFIGGAKASESLGLINSAKKNKKRDEVIGNLVKKDSALKDKLNVIQKETGVTEKSTTNENGNNLKYLNEQGRE